MKILVYIICFTNIAFVTTDQKVLSPQKLNIQAGADTQLISRC